MGFPGGFIEGDLLGDLSEVSEAFSLLARRTWTLSLLVVAL